MCAISVERKRDETTAAEWEGRTLWGVRGHITQIGYALRRRKESPFSWHHLTFAVKERTFKLVYLTMFFPGVHSWFYYKRWMPWQPGVLVFSSKWFLHWTHVQTVRISADWQHHGTDWWAARRWNDAHTDTDPIKTDESPVGKSLQVGNKKGAKPCVSAAHQGAKYFMWKQPCMVFCSIPEV